MGHLMMMILCPKGQAMLGLKRLEWNEKDMYPPATQQLSCHQMNHND
jgi:hypothetical protein